ncbi:hypothetical protein H6G36_30030 [Anabaena minutissima FACHB-250]|nr:hypothetical protein [Anabaena minutissima FACHB-250]
MEANKVRLKLWVGRDVALQRLYKRYCFGKLSYPNRIGMEANSYLSSG